jgi:hypothetical protein
MRTKQLLQMRTPSQIMPVFMHSRAHRINRGTNAAPALLCWSRSAGKGKGTGVVAFAPP